MIMVLSCFDFLTVITIHPLLVARLVLWMKEENDLNTKVAFYAHLASIFPRFSLVALLVLNLERYLAACYPLFHRSSITRRKLFTLLAILLLLPTTLTMISANSATISHRMASIILMVILLPPFIFINYKLLRISNKMRRKSSISPGERRISLKNISTCLLAVACLVLLSIISGVYVAYHSNGKMSSNNDSTVAWPGTMVAMNSTFNGLIFFWKNKVLRAEGKKVLKTIRGHFMS